MDVVHLKVVFMDGEVRTFDVPEGGSWFPHNHLADSGEGVEMLIVKPQDAGIPRFQIPMRNIRYFQVTKTVENEDQDEESDRVSTQGFVGRGGIRPGIPLGLRTHPGRPKGVVEK